LDERGWSTQRQQASWLLRFPTRLLTFFASGAIDDLVAENLTVLSAPSLEVVLYPADLVINGKKEDVAHARAAIAERLSFSEAHLTWTKEGNELEDQLNDLWRRIKGTRGKSYWTRAAASLQDIDRELGRLEVPFEEWEVLFRTKLLLERELLGAIATSSEETQQLPHEYVKRAGARLLEEDATEGKKGMDKRPGRGSRVRLINMLWRLAAAWDATVTPEGENSPITNPGCDSPVTSNLAGVLGKEDGHIGVIAVDNLHI
jgi:hypothetical protein